MVSTLGNRPIQSLWIGGQLSKVEQLCIRSFLDHGHQFHLYVYDDVADVPVRTTLRDARDILPQSAVFAYQYGWGKGSFTGFADQFRLEMIHQIGGWWVDMDVICLQPFDFEQSRIICSSFEGEHGILVNSCVFTTPPGDIFTSECLHRLNKLDVKEIHFGDIGPFLFQKVAKDLQLTEHIAPYQYFNPIYWRYMNELILGLQSPSQCLKELIRPLLKPQTMPGRRITDNSYAVHLWNEVWRYNNFDKNGTYRASSLFETLKRKHGIKY